VKALHLRLLEPRPTGHDWTSLGLLTLPCAARAANQTTTLRRLWRGKCILSVRAVWTVDKNKVSLSGWSAHDARRWQMQIVSPTVSVAASMRWCCSEHTHTELSSTELLLSSLNCSVLLTDRVLCHSLKGEDISSTAEECASAPG